MDDEVRSRPPAVTWAYGLLGLIPFVAAAAAALLLGGGLIRWGAQSALLAYGGLILTFLGGGRWGLEVGRAQVRAGVISASMAPAIVSTLLLAMQGVPPAWRLIAMAIAHVAQWAWDVTSRAPPRWYPTLRHVLTAGAVGSLLAGAIASTLG